MVVTAGNLAASKQSAADARRRRLAAGRRRPQYEVTVAPGDTEIERGTSLIVTARSTADVPDDATLVYRDTVGRGDPRVPMSLSLSDPMFGGRVAEVQSDLTYRVEYADQATREFQVTVFDYPRTGAGRRRAGVSRVHALWRRSGSRTPGGSRRSKAPS